MVRYVWIPLIATPKTDSTSESRSPPWRSSCPPWNLVNAKERDRAASGPAHLTRPQETLAGHGFSFQVFWDMLLPTDHPFIVHISPFLVHISSICLPFVIHLSSIYHPSIIYHQSIYFLVPNRPYRKARNSCLSHACVLKICFRPSKCSFQEVMHVSRLQPKSPSKCRNLGFILITDTSSIAQGGGGSFKDSKPGSVGLLSCMGGRASR